MIHPIFEVNELTIRFGESTVIAHWSFSCRTGEAVVLTGPNGCGKTTLLNVLTGMIKPTEGSIRFNGKPTHRNWSPRRAYQNGVRRSFQIPRNWESLNLAENLLLISKDTTEALQDLIQRTFTGRPYTLSPTQLSFGQRRLLELLRITQSLPCRIVLLDEPYSGLDVLTSDAVKRIIRNLLDAGIAIIAVDHEPDRWTDANRVVIMNSSS